MTVNTRPKRALLAYCALAQRLSKPGVGITHALIPFFTEANHDLVGQLFDAEKFSLAVSQRFGFSIPRLAALGLTEQLELAGLLEVVSRDGSRTVYKHAAMIPENESVNPVTEAQVERVLSAFFDYCIDDQKINTMERSAIDAAFLHRLLNADSMRILGRKETSITTKRSVDTLSLLRVPRREDQLNGDELHLDYKTSQFLLDIQTKDRAAFELVSDVAFANMAAEAIAVFQEPADTNVPLSGLTIYLDSPILLDMLGVNWEYAEYGSELLATIKNSGARVAVFDHCVMEAEGAIGAQLSYLRSGINSSAHRLGISAKPDLLAALKDRVGERAYERLGIDVERDPEVNLHRHNPTVVGDIEAGMNTSMQAWGNVEAKAHDRKSVWSMLTMRDSSQPCPRVCDSKWIFLSRNTALVKIANAAWTRWLKGTTKHSITHVEKWAPIAMSDKQFAGYIWTRTGGTRSSIPVARLLANCSAAVRPRADVKARAYNLIIELEGREQADDLAALLEDREGAKALMRAVSGDPEDVTRERIPFIIEQVKLAAGEFAAARAREEGELILHERSLAYQAEIDRVSQELVETEGKYVDDLNTVNAKKVQLHEERECLEAQNKILLDALAAKDLAEMERRLTIIAGGFAKGVKTYVRTKWLIVILFTVLTGSVTHLSTDSPTASFVLSTFLAFLGFWFVPDILSGPLNRLSTSVLMKHVSRHDNSINVPHNPPPNFRDNEWCVLNSTHEPVANSSMP
ncbi:MAG: hypothetical protein A3I66_18810 [Burkholderiales bacterium RIFCSPLOWO2_02_FULL_57_36]|nr:MAG: hypothetical protein A3I66_18810 [Burkholderiales bacterium RIFCSPLOWO2_02_FULL_57_36]